MAEIAWERPGKCPVVNGYVIRVMTKVPVSPKSVSVSTDRESGEHRQKQIPTDGDMPAKDE